METKPERNRQRDIMIRKTGLSRGKTGTACHLVPADTQYTVAVSFRAGKQDSSPPREDHHRGLAACIRQVLPDWKRPAGRPSHTWLRAIEADLGPLNFGLATAWRKATILETNGHIIVDSATLQRSTL